MSDVSKCTRASSWKPTTDPTLSWRWVRVAGELVVEQRRGATSTVCAPGQVNEAAWRGERDAVAVQRSVGGAR